MNNIASTTRSTGTTAIPCGVAPVERIALDQITAGFWRRVDRSGGPDACWPWLGAVSKKGYGHLMVLSRWWVASRLAYTIAHGPIPDGLQICHHCDNPPCRNPSHLFAGTNQANVDDRTAKGRGAYGQPPVRRGDSNGQSRLSQADVEQIRAMAAQGLSFRAIARSFGVGKTTVGNVVARESWTHI